MFVGKRVSFLQHTDRIGMPDLKPICIESSPMRANVQADPRAMHFELKFAF
jgi:hypothetical protein